MHYLESLLQWQLASDESTFVHLPQVLASLTPSHFSDFPHTSRWVARVNSLIHAKDAEARWTGLCLAHQTACCSKEILMDQAQHWISSVIPSLSRNEPPPYHASGIRLLSFILETTLEIPEFQRQVVLPSVPKFSYALLALCDKTSNPDLKNLAYQKLCSNILFYPSSHRSLEPQLLSHSQKLITEAFFHSDRSQLEVVIRLYSLVPLTAGKVGSATRWKALMEEALGEARKLLQDIKSHSDYGASPTHTLPSRHAPSEPDSLVVNTHRIAHLGIQIIVLCHLLKSPITRYVSVPVGRLMQFVHDLFNFALEEDSNKRGSTNMPMTQPYAISELWRAACQLLQQLAFSAREHLAAYLPATIVFISVQLEEGAPPTLKTQLLKSVTAVLVNAPGVHDPISSSRLTRAVLSNLTPLLATKLEAQTAIGNGAQGSKEKKRKSRSSTYEGQEIFAASKSILYTNPEDGEVLLASLDALNPLLLTPALPTSLRSLSCRFLLSLALRLPQITASSLSMNTELHISLLKRVNELCSEVAFGTSGLIGNAIEIIMGSSRRVDLYHVKRDGINYDQFLELLIHPRIPPLHKAPNIHTFPLIIAEESPEDKRTRDLLGLDVSENVTPANQQLAIRVELPVETAFTLTSKETLKKQVFPEPFLPPKVAPLARETEQETSPVQVMKKFDPLQANITKEKQPAIISSSVASGTRLNEAGSKIEDKNVQQPAQSPTLDTSLNVNFLNESDPEEPMPEINMESSDEEEEV